MGGDEHLMALPRTALTGSESSGRGGEGLGSVQKHSDDLQECRKPVSVHAKKLKVLVNVGSSFSHVPLRPFDLSFGFIFMSYFP
jgi:hypothetical protein